MSEQKDYYRPVDDPQEPLFSDLEDWKTEWVGMPEFVQEELEPFAAITVRFASGEDMEAFAKLIGQPLTEKTKSIWHPKLERGFAAGKRWTSEP